MKKRAIYRIRNPLRYQREDHSFLIFNSLNKWYDMNEDKVGIYWITLKKMNTTSNGAVSYLAKEYRIRRPVIEKTLDDFFSILQVRNKSYSMFNNINRGGGLFMDNQTDESTVSNKGKSKTAVYVWGGSIIFGLLFTLLIWLLGPNLNHFYAILLPDQGSSWYFWKLPSREFWTMTMCGFLSG